MTETKWEGRFRVAGTNYEGRSWTLVPSLVVLARQVSNLYPENQPGDGTVASKRHDEVSPNSDHRPRPHTGPGVVRAIDVGEHLDDDPMVDALIKSRDPRIAYVIYEGQAVYSWPHNGYPAWTIQPYRGAAPHSGHFHLSTLRSETHDRDTRLWTITDEEDPMGSPSNWTEDDWALFDLHANPHIGVGSRRRRVSQAIANIELAVTGLEDRDVATDEDVQAAADGIIEAVPDVVLDRIAAVWRQ